MDSKHAYLIMAHADPEHLQNLVNALDDERNDIFIHIDGKEDITKFKNIACKRSNLEFLKRRIDVFWGDPSQIDAEYALFHCVGGGRYSRIHLISGADFPIKSQDYIHEFFDKHKDEEFIDYEDERNLTSELSKKMRLYNFFLPYISHPDKYIASFFNFVRRVLLVLQMCLGINRHYSMNVIKKGSNWASMTQAFVDELLKHEKKIKREYRYTHCCDEIYKQTIAWNTSFRNKISILGNMRIIDFSRGNGKNPYTFQSMDYDILRQSNSLFARKFSSAISQELILRLEKNISNRH